MEARKPTAKSFDIVSDYTDQINKKRTSIYMKLYVILFIFYSLSLIFEITKGLLGEMKSTIVSMVLMYAILLVIIGTIICFENSIFPPRYFDLFVSVMHLLLYITLFATFDFWKE